MCSLNYFQKLNKFFKLRKTLLYNNNRIYNFAPDINNLYFYLKLNCVTMKKVLLASSLLLASVISAFAQVPDASGWKVEDDISNQIGWGNLNFTNSPMDYWTLTSDGGNITTTGGLVEIYNGTNCELYQYVELPAGMYKVECQGYYRHGNSWAEDAATFETENWNDYAILYAQGGVYNLEDSSFTADRTFKAPLMPRLFPRVEQQLFEDLNYTLNEDGSKNFAAGWDMSDGNYLNGTVWAPTSIDGSKVYFAEGHYGPYNDGKGTKYNTVTFYIDEPGYVKIGVSKTEAKDADCFMVTNFKMYYMGEAGDVAKLMAAQEEVTEYYNLIKDIEESYSGGMLYSLISDAIMEFDSEYGEIDRIDNIETCEAARDILKALYEGAATAETAYKQIVAVLPTMEQLYNSTDYAGKVAFGENITAAQNCVDVNYEIGDEDTFETFVNVYNELVSSRIAYLMTQEKVNGAYNFSSAINMPFFCDNEYTPIWSADANAYVFPTIEGVDEALQPENTWATIQEQGYSEAKTSEEGRSEWIPICENFTISQNEVEGQWVIKSTTWHGGGAIGVTMQHSYPAVGGWTAEPSGNPEHLYQIITGLPNGFYAMSALMCNAGADISDLQYAYIKTADAEEKAPLTMKGNPWWGGNKESWRSGVWEKLTTNMVYVSDGKVTIGTASDAFYASTGFQLYYYGETPDFTSLIAPALQAAKDNAATLTWAGDIAAVNALLNSIPETIDSQEAYQNATATIAEANAYVSAANAAIANWKAIDDFNNLLAAQVEGSTEATIVEVALMYAIGLGEGENDTYLDAIASGKDYTAYVNYLAYRAGMGELINDAAIATVIAEQNTYLTGNYANAAKIDEFKAALATPYNKALLSSLGIDKASETNPVDVSILLVNPKFEEGSKGWDGEITVDTIQDIAERWNCDFNVSQTINSLPAGCYQIQAQIFYRDGGDATTAYNNWYYNAVEEMEFWENPNVLFYANERDTTVVSLASEMFTDQMTQYISGWKEADELGADGSIVMEPTWVYQADAAEDAKNNHPWDQVVEDFGEIYYYPNSVQGSAHRFAKNPEAYINKIEVMVEEGGSLTFGIKNIAFIGSHWCVFDNFKLYYLGADPSTAIEDIAPAADEDAPVYNVAGQIVDKSYKGIVIKNGVKFINK